MKTEDAIRTALRREAARHTVNSSLPPSTIVKARVSRFVVVTGVTATVAALIVGGLSVVNLGGASGTGAGPGPRPASEPESPRWTSTGLPLLLVTQEGWKVTGADQYDRDVGELAFRRGEQVLTLSWRADEDHQSYLEDRQYEAARSWNVTIAGRPATLIQYEGTTDFTALWLDGDHSLELRGVFPTVDDYNAVAATLDFVDKDAWLAALPDSTVPTADRPQVVDAMLADIPVPNEVNVDALKTRPIMRDRYQLGADVSGAVACAWIERWVHAKADHDAASAQAATDAMATSKKWAILQEMQPEGGYSEVLWEYADAMAGDGSVSGGSVMSVEDTYRSALGCREQANPNPG